MLKYTTYDIRDTLHASRDTKYERPIMSNYAKQSQFQNRSQSTEVRRQMTDDRKQSTGCLTAKTSKSVQNLHLNYVLACQTTFSKIVENPLQIGPIFYKTKPIFEKVKWM